MLLLRINSLAKSGNRHLLWWLVLLAVALACSIDKKRTLPHTESARDHEQLAGRAQALFAAEPRQIDAARDALSLMQEAARACPPDSPRRFAYLASLARYAIWLALHDGDDGRKSDYASAAITACNTAIQQDSSRVEGYYFRAVAIGLYAQANKLTGRSAMQDMRDDARRAIAIDAGFESGGPHRVLGALYLRAPGPPAGIGSRQRALVELEAALQIAPAHPENLLFLAEACLAARRFEQASELLARARSVLATVEDRWDLARWRSHFDELWVELEQKAGK